MKSLLFSCLLLTTFSLTADDTHDYYEQYVLDSDESYQESEVAYVDTSPALIREMPSQEEVVARTYESPYDHTSEKEPASDIPAFNGTYEDAIVKTAIILVSILVAVLIIVWIARRLSGSRSSKLNYLKSIKVIERRPLSPKSMLYIVEVGGKQMVIAESQNHIAPISTLDWSGESKDL